MKIKPTLLLLVMCLATCTFFGQTIVCEDASCTANDYTLDYFYLGDENGVAYGPGYCDLGVSLETHIWTTFITNSAADRYSLYIHFNVYINEEFVETVDECHYEYERVPANVLTDLYKFNWGCGDDIKVRDFYMSWQPNNSKGCDCQGAKCYKEEEIDVRGPLIANYQYIKNCDNPYSVDFISTTKGGLPPYDYTYLWEFGDGTTSILANPTHSFATSGPYQVTLIVNDTKDTVSTTQEVNNIESNFPPEVVAPGDVSVEGCGTMNIPILPYSSVEISITEGHFNAYGGSLVLTNDLSSLTYIDAIDNASCPTVITRTFTAIDDCNNSGIGTQQITINDTTFPTASNPSTLLVQCSADIPSPDPNVVADASDNCPNLTITWLSDLSNNNSCPETIVRTYNVSDACGNSIDVTQMIKVNDDTPPTGTAPADATYECIDFVPLPDPDIIIDKADNCSMPIVAFVSETSNNAKCPEILTRTYSLTDNCGNVTYLTQNITISDTVPPFIQTEALDSNVECDGNGNSTEFNAWLSSNAGAVATDNCKNVTWTNNFTALSDLCGLTGTATVTFTATDDCGNTATTTATFSIQDTTTPSERTLSPINLSCIQNLPEPDTSIISDTSDYCSLTNVSFISDVSDGNTCPETVTRTYRVFDECNNYVDIIQIMTVNDIVPPTASNPATTYISSNDAIPVQDANVVIDEADNCGIPTVEFVTETSTKGTCEEIIQRIYSVTDACGNSILVKHNIVVADATPPIAGQLFTMELYGCNEEIPQPDTSLITNVIDNYSNPMVTFYSDVVVEQSCPRTIVRTYRVTDECNNYLNVEQVIIVDDNVPPTASNPNRTLLSSNDNIPSPDPEIVIDEADNCGIPTVAFVFESSNNDLCNEIITRTYRITDPCGNYTDVFHEIEVVDNIAPTAITPDDIIINCISNVPNIDISTIRNAQDNKGSPTVEFISEIKNTQDCDDVITRTYRISDSCGNSIDVQHNIFIIDDLGPIMDITMDSEFTLNCELKPSVPIVTFSDNCTSKVPVVFDEQTINIDSNNYDIIRRWTATDYCDNKTVFEQTIHMTSYSETTDTPLNICIDEAAFDINAFVNQNNNGVWSGSDMTVLKGTMFDPANTPEGIYIFIYNVEINSCSITNNFEINLNDDCIVYSCIESEMDVNISKIITPNNDTQNEIFEVIYRLNDKIDNLSNCNIVMHLQIFNRWGTKVFESTDYDNTWKGDAPNAAIGKADKLPAGTYYYILDLKNSGLKPIQSYIYLGTE